MIDVRVALQARPGIWNRSHYLDRMTLKELVVAYFQYPAIIAYLLLSALSLGVFVWQPAGLVPALASVVMAVMAYPLVWYSLHRWVLHGRWMYKIKPMAPVWKRIHYDHHQDPNHLEVLFGALYTTLPTIAIFLVPVGWLIGGLGGAAIAFSTGLLTTCFYEFCHCIQHLHYTPKIKFFRVIKRLHLLHHFRNENGNYGITNYLWDRLFGTYYDKQDKWGKSPTVYNLGYDEQQAALYPWVAELTNSSD